MARVEYEPLDLAVYWESPGAPEEADVLGILSQEDLFHLADDSLPLFNVQLLRLLLVELFEPARMFKAGPGGSTGAPSIHGAAPKLAKANIWVSQF
jgi:hypothetical protein